MSFTQTKRSVQWAFRTGKLAKRKRFKKIFLFSSFPLPKKKTRKKLKKKKKKRFWPREGEKKIALHFVRTTCSENMIYCELKEWGVKTEKEKKKEMTKSFGGKNYFGKALHLRFWITNERNSENPRSM